MPTRTEIEERALGLTAEERAKLVDILLESLYEPTPEIQRAWAEEIERRVAAYDRGEIRTRDAEDVFAQARRISR
jgi:putative addiction module component (TIGR02574 family)